MSHNIDFTNGRANMAFRGDRDNIWHRLGHQKQPGESIDSWARDAGLDWTAIMVPSIVDLRGPQFHHLPESSRMIAADGDRYIVRSDTGGVLGHVSDGYQPVQPRDVLDWFERYIAVDSRFQLDVAGSLKDGRIIWATATYNEQDDSSAIGKHTARLLMTTTFDGTASTVNKATMTRVVCNNTLDAALADPDCTIKTRHNTKFDHARIGRELSRIAHGFDKYREMAESMARVELKNGDISLFFKKVLDIDFSAKAEDISARKMNQFKALGDAYKETVREGTQPNTAWTALNAVTRWVDHDRSVKGGADVDAARFHSAQFGSGAGIKADAVAVLQLLSQDETRKVFLGAAVDEPAKTIGADSNAVARLLSSVN